MSCDVGKEWKRSGFPMRETIQNANGKQFHAVSLSGGKDSTAMLLLMIERDMPIDMVLSADTGMEFPEMYEHLAKLDEHLFRERGIRDHYRDNRLDTAAVDQVVQQFGYDRTFHVLAITVCQADWDRRYSPDNRAWANAMSIPANSDTWGTDRNCYLAVNSHPGLVDLFLSQTRKAYAQERQKTSVRDKLKKPPETTSPKISAKSKAPER